MASAQAPSKEHWFFFVLRVNKNLYHVPLFQDYYPPIIIRSLLITTVKTVSGRIELKHCSLLVDIDIAGLISDLGKHPEICSES